MSGAGAARLGIRGARGAARGGRRLVGRLGRYVDEGGDAARAGGRAGARAGDEAADGGQSAARWWASRGAGVAGVAGAGGLAYRGLGTMSDRAQAREAEAYTDLNEYQAEAAASNGDDGGDDPGPDVKGILEQLRDAIPGVETIQDVIVVLVIGAIVLHFVMNRSSDLPNSPIVIGGGR